MGALLDLAMSATEREEVAAMPAALKPSPAASAVPHDASATARKAHALAYLEAHQNVRRACFADTKADPENVILTVAIREPWGAVEVLVRRSRFDPFQLIELVNRYPDTSLFIPEH